MKLISMSDFVLDKYNNVPVENYNQVDEKFINSVIKYAEFLKQPLMLGMFIPCDENGEIIVERHYQYFNNEIEHSDYLKCFEKAKEKVLFDNVQIQNSIEIIHLYDGIRVLNFNQNMNQEKWFSEVFEKDGKERFKKTIEDLIVFDLNLDLAVSF